MRRCWRSRLWVFPARKWELSLEDRVRPVLVRRDNKRVAALLEEPPQAKLPGNAAQKLTRLEVDPLGGRRCLTVVVALDPGNRISSVRPWMALNGILVQDTENLCHLCLTFSPCAPGMARRF